jgi:hypothetical protein
MTRSLLGAALAIAMGGCVYPQHTVVRSGEKNSLVVISLDNVTSYLVDPRTETCLLVHADTRSTYAAPVSCAKLKSALPEAARVITWTEAAPPLR